MSSAAYLILSHRLPDQLLRLARVLDSGGARHVGIHHDPSGEPVDTAALERLASVRLIRPARTVAWGWASQLDTLLWAMEETLSASDFEWLIVLSGQDYPVRPLARIEADLRAGGYDGYVQGELVPAPSLTRRLVDEFAARYHYRHRRVPPPGPRRRRAIVAARPLLTLRAMPWGCLLGHRVCGPFPAGMPCRRGQDWLTLSRRAVAALVGAARERPRLREHYRHTPHPTESFPHTVLHADPSLKLSQDPRRFSAWTRPGSPHPDVLRRFDLDAILASGTDFARKFDSTIDSEVLDALDAVVAAG